MLFLRTCRYASNAENAVGVVFFLRFVCPVIVIPQKYGLVNKNTVLTADHRRGLMLVAKMLQNLVSFWLYRFLHSFLPQLLFPSWPTACSWSTRVIIASVLPAYVIQANNVLFGPKEPFMEVFNGFIRENYPSVLKFYDDICDMSKS